MTLLHAKPEVAARERMVDDSSGKVEVRPVRARSASGVFLLQRRHSVCFLLHSTFPYCLRSVELAVYHFRKVRDTFLNALSPGRYVPVTCEDLGYLMGGPGPL